MNSVCACVEWSVYVCAMAKINKNTNTMIRVTLGDTKGIVKTI